MRRLAKEMLRITCAPSGNRYHHRRLKRDGQLTPSCSGDQPKPVPKPHMLVVAINTREVCKNSILVSVSWKANAGSEGVLPRHGSMGRAMSLPRSGRWHGGEGVLGPPLKGGAADSTYA